MQDRWTRLIGVSLLFLSLVAQPVIAYTFRAQTWDDSAITMAFARTFADTGKVEGTPGSGVVEGYSTTLWMLVLAGTAKIATTPAALLAMAKTLTCLLTLGNILLIRAIIRSWGQATLADLTAATYGLLTLTLQESINGMEDPMMLSLMLIAVLCLRGTGAKSRAVFLLSSSLFLLCRHEAFLLMAPMLLLVNPLRRRVTSAAVWLAVLIASTVIRWRYFGSVLPNTITAKRHFPYSAPTMRLEMMRHLIPAFTLVHGLDILFLVVLYAAFVRRQYLYAALKRIHTADFWERLGHAISRADDLKVALLLAAVGVCLSLAIGYNWGPPNREIYVALPFLIYLILRLTFRLLNTRLWQRQAAILLLIPIVYLTVHNIAILNSRYAPLYQPLMTVQNVASLVPPVEQIRRAAGLQELTIATPDVGGVMLFGEQLRVIDLGLLCDRRLAQQGYAIAPRYILEERTPEIIGIHQQWTELTGLEKIPDFYRNYRVMILDRQRFFVRRDVFDRIASQTVTRSFGRNGHPLPEDDLVPSGETIYPGFYSYTYPGFYSSGDYKINASFGTYATILTAKLPINKN
ncbi:MAG: hypothetical protein WA869_30515 [Alloacidobacterium sp.]